MPNQPTAEIEKLPRIEDPRGNLSFIERGPWCPFDLGRIAWLYDVAAAARHTRPISRVDEMIVAMSGSFDVVVDGRHRRHLNRSDRAIIIPAGAHATLDNFSTNSVALFIDANPRRPLPAPPAPDPHPASSVDRVELITLPRIRHDSASLTPIDTAQSVCPFEVRRVFYLFDVPADAERGGHSHYQARELIVALTGSFDVILDDGCRRPRRFTLNRPYQGLYVPTGLWRTLDNFSGGAVCMVLTSEPYSEDDYVRSYERFKQLTNPKR